MIQGRGDALKWSVSHLKNLNSLGGMSEEDEGWRTLTGGGGRETRRNVLEGAVGGLGSDECYDNIEPVFSGFGDMESSIYRRVLLVEKKLNTWIDRVKVMKEEDVRGKRLDSELRSRVRNLEEREKHLVQENEELKEKLVKYESMVKEGLGVVQKENEDLKVIMDKEEVLGEMKTWKVEHEKLI